MQDMIDYHGQIPPAVAHKGAIYIVGKSGMRVSRSVSKFRPFDNKWVKLVDKITPTSNSITVGFNNFIYSIGGAIDQFQEVTDAVERFDVISCKWEALSSLITARDQATGTVHAEHIYVFGGKTCQLETLNTVERFDVKNGQWTMFASMMRPRWGEMFRCHAINDEIYIVGGDTDRYAGKTIEKYNFGSDKSSIVVICQLEEDVEIWSSVIVELPDRSGNQMAD